MFGVLADLVRLLAVLPMVEHGRRSRGPAELLGDLRRRGMAGRRREDVERRRLRRMISLLDRCLPGGGNCYRRVLWEVALDPDAACKPIVFGLKARGGPFSGHAWVSQPETEEAEGGYDVRFAI